MALSPAIALTQNNEPVFATSKKATKKTIKTSANGITLYNEKGNFYTGKKKVKSNSTIKTYGKPVWITSRISLLSSDSFPIIKINNGQNYVWLGDNGYIKSNCLGSISNKGVINIARKGYVYDKNGKRLKSYRGGKATVTRNQKIKYAGKLTETSRELFYHLIGTTFSMRDPHSKYEYTWVKQKIGSVYVKASDVTFKGLKVKTQNTAEEATKLAEK